MPQLGLYVPRRVMGVVRNYHVLWRADGKYDGSQGGGNS